MKLARWFAEPMLWCLFSPPGVVGILPVAPINRRRSLRQRCLWNGCAQGRLIRVSPEGSRIEPLELGEKVVVLENILEATETRGGNNAFKHGGRISPPNTECFLQATQIVEAAEAAKRSKGWLVAGGGGGEAYRV